MYNLCIPFFRDEQTDTIKVGGGYRVLVDSIKVISALASSLGIYRWRSLFMESLRCADHRPVRTGEERERLVTASPEMTKSRGPSWGRKNYPKNGLVDSPRLATRALSPAGMFGGKAPPRLAAQKSRPHAHLGPMRGAPAHFLCK